MAPPGVGLAPPRANNGWVRFQPARSAKVGQISAGVDNGYAALAAAPVRALGPSQSLAPLGSEARPLSEEAEPFLQQRRQIQQALFVPEGRHELQSKRQTFGREPGRD